MSKVRFKRKVDLDMLRKNLIKNFFYSLKIIRKYDKTYALNKLIITLCEATIAFSAAYLIKIAVSAIEENKDFKDFIFEIAIYSAITLALYIITRVCNNLSWAKNYRLSILLRQERSVRTLDIDYEVLERPETQDEIEKVARATGEWNGPLGLINRAFYIMSSILSFLIACAIVVSVNPLLIILISVLALVKMFFENTDKKKMKTEFSDKTPAIWRRISYVNNIATNFGIGKDVRVYRMDQFIEEERKKSTNAFLDLLKKSNRKSNFYQGAIRIVSMLDTLMIYGFMAYEVINHNMSIATFTFMVSSIFNLTGSLYSIIFNNSWLLRANAETEDYRVFMEKNYVIEKETDEIDEKEVSIEFKDVYYSYYGQEGYALNGVSFKINNGEKIALVGYNGDGKTTIVKLISGFYHPTKGQILINGKDIETLKREEIDKLISSSYQESLNLAYSIGENVAMLPKKEIDYEKVDKILKLVGLDKKVNELPNKVDTILTRDFDDKGVDLSGGETQKLSIARAIYKNAPLFIFDEPTSAMDAISESELYENFNEITKNNTTIYISHRLSSAKFCDRIIVLDHGKVTEMGTHKELIDKNGEYKKLFEMQSEYYKGGESNE